MDIEELAARLQRLEDLAAIQQLFVDYGRYLDAGDVAGYASLFADDGEVLLGPVGRAKGPAEIEALMAKTISGGVGNTYHLVTSPKVELDGDAATSVVMWTVVDRGDGANPKVTMVGEHRDRLVRQRGEWRFARREGHIHIPTTYRR